jgi:hypothetical protein
VIVEPGRPLFRRRQNCVGVPLKYGTGPAFGLRSSRCPFGAYLVLHGHVGFGRRGRARFRQAFPNRPCTIRLPTASVNGTAFARLSSSAQSVVEPAERGERQLPGRGLQPLIQRTRPPTVCVRTQRAHQVLARTEHRDTMPPQVYEPVPRGQRIRASRVRKRSIARRQSPEPPVHGPGRTWPVRVHEEEVVVDQHRHLLRDQWFPAQLQDAEPSEEK